MSHTSIYESISHLKKYFLTLRSTVLDTFIALRIIREKVSRLTNRSLEEMKSSPSETMLHYIYLFFPDEVDQRMKKRNVVQRLKLFEVCSDWFLPLSICLLTRSRNRTNRPSNPGVKRSTGRAIHRNLGVGRSTRRVVHRHLGVGRSTVCSSSFTFSLSDILQKLNQETMQNRSLRNV